MILATDTQVRCDHCALPVPVGLIAANRQEQFCCHGCQIAYDLIHEHGLDSFYRIGNDEANRRSQYERGTQSFDYRFFDEPAFLEKYADRVSDSVSKIMLHVEGIHCGACVWLLEKLPSMLPGVEQSTINWARRTVMVRWRTEEIPLSKIVATFARLGYPVCPTRESERQIQWNLTNRKHLIRIGVAAALAGNCMMISAALYLGMFGHMTPAMTHLMRIASGAIGVLTLAWPGRGFLRSAISAIWSRTAHMDLPIALALSVGTVAGFVNVLRGAGEIYFDSLSVLIFLLLVGRWIQFRQQSKAADAVDLLYQLTPQKATKVVDGQLVETLVELIQPGDQLKIQPGELFPVDGKILDGDTEVDESILTGESIPVARSPGSVVFAGTRNECSPVVMRTEKVGSETRINKVVDLVEQASLEKPEVVLWANQVGGIFVIVVMLLAMTTFVRWIGTDMELAVDRTIALLNRSMSVRIGPGNSFGGCRSPGAGCQSKNHGQRRGCPPIASASRRDLVGQDGNDYRG